MDRFLKGIRDGKKFSGETYYSSYRLSGIQKHIINKQNIVYDLIGN